MTNDSKTSIWTRIHIDPWLILSIITILIYSLFILWSASGQNQSMINSRIIQIILGFLIMLIIAQFSPRFYEKIAPYLYIICLVLLILVDLIGYTSKGAQRWLDLGFFRFQPSEIAKIAVPLMVTKFINRETCPPSLLDVLIAFLLTLIPTLLIAMEPDLGTALLVFSTGIFIIFLAGVSLRVISISLTGLIAFLPIMWFYLMHDYQRQRVITMLNPESDPLNKGYHIIQSKIAIGSGGLWGKGWLQGTQSQLEYIPERHTDFIFAVLAEEFGLIGVIVLLTLYLCIIIRGFTIAMRAQTLFGRVLVGGITLTLFVYLFVNIGMVSGILPVVGVPLPFISYGGSALIVLMANFGLVMSIHTHRKMFSKNL